MLAALVAELRQRSDEDAEKDDEAVAELLASRRADRARSNGGVQLDSSDGFSVAA